MLGLNCLFFCWPILKFAQFYRMSKSYPTTDPSEWATIEIFPLKRGSSTASFLTIVFICSVNVSRILGLNLGLRYAKQSGTVLSKAYLASIHLDGTAHCFSRWPNLKDFSISVFQSTTWVTIWYLLSICPPCVTFCICSCKLVSFTLYCSKSAPIPWITRIR